MNLRQGIRDSLHKEPTLTNKQLYNLFPKGNRTSIRVYANEVRNALNSDITPKKSRSSFSQDDSSTKFIDDPNELLLSVAIRELNKSDPDPRWASILINCKKEKITTKGEVIDQFRQLTTQGLVNILSKSLQKES